MKELQQLHDITAIVPKMQDDLTQEDKLKTLRY